jgi:hypothetical protein
VSKPRNTGRRAGAPSRRCQGLVRGRLGPGAVGVGGVDDDVARQRSHLGQCLVDGTRGTASITYAGARDHLGGERGAGAIAHVGGAGGELTGCRDMEITTS